MHSHWKRLYRQGSCAIGLVAFLGGGACGEADKPLMGATAGSPSTPTSPTGATSAGSPGTVGALPMQDTQGLGAMQGTRAPAMGEAPSGTSAGAPSSVAVSPAGTSASGMAGSTTAGSAIPGAGVAGVAADESEEGEARADDLDETSAPEAEDGEGAGSREPVFQVFLLLGQSNMEGYPKAQPADRMEDERITVLGYDDCNITGRKKDQWDVAAPPLHSCWNDGLGPGDYFAKTLIEALPAGDTIGLVPCAINGERIETFMKGSGSKYEWIVQRARMAQEKGGVIAGIIFHQGESNNGDASWPGKVKTLLDDLKADLELGPIPFVAGELLYSGSGRQHNPLINMLPDLVENAYVVSAEGLEVDPADVQWRLHFSHDSVVTQGKRYGETMIEALGL